MIVKIILIDNGQAFKSAHYYFYSLIPLSSEKYMKTIKKGNKNDVLRMPVTCWRTHEKKYY